MKKKAESEKMPDTNYKTLGVTFSKEEANRIEALSNETGQTVHALMKYAILYMLKYKDDPKKFQFKYDKLGEP